MTVDLPMLAEFRPAPDDPLVARVRASGRKWGEGEKRIITGADLLGRIQRRIVRRVERR